MSCLKSGVSQYLKAIFFFYPGKRTTAIILESQMTMECRAIPHGGSQETA